MVDFSEGLYFGYRWYDHEGKQALYPFGHGLSYTTFTYENAVVEQSGTSVSVSVDVTNTGSVPGDEIVQVYLGGGTVPEYAQLADKQLAAFCRLEHLHPGETRHAVIRIDPRNFCYWDVNQEVTMSSWGTKGKWTPVAGVRTVLVGGSPLKLLQAGNVAMK